MLQFFITTILFIFIFLNNKYKNILFILIFFFICFNIIYKINFFNFFRLFFLDWYNILFILILLTIRILIIYYSRWYFFFEPKKKIFIYYLVIFIFFIFFFFSFNIIIFILLRWERIRIISYLLINWWNRRNDARVSRQQAVIYNRVGDFFIYFFIFILLNYYFNLNRLNYFNLLIFIFFFISIVSKSSLFLFHPWLPNAIERPTPVSSLLHSSTIVVARVFLFIRFNEIFNIHMINVIRFFRRITIVYRRICSLRQFDLKKIIAYSTTSQLRFIIIIVSFLRSFYRILFLIFHAFFKSLLFLISRLFIHESNRIQYINKINLFNNKISSLIYMFSVISLIGIPFFSRFFSKDLILENIWRELINCFFIFIFFLRCRFTISYCFKLINFKYFFSNKLFSISFFRKNVLWIYVLSILLFINSFFFFINIFNENYLSFNIKLLILILFFVGFFIFFFFKKKNNFVVFYNPLFHRIFFFFFIKINKSIIIIEYKWLEFRLSFLKLPLFFRFKIVLLLLFLFFILF